MKKVYFAVYLFIVLNLAACSKNTSNVTTTAPVQDITVETIDSTETNSNSESSKNDILADDEIMPEANQLSEKLASALIEIGASESTNMEYEKYNKHDDGDIDLDLVIDGGLHKLKISCYYANLIHSWLIISITNYDNKNYYYVGPGSAGLVDIYDYKSNELLSSKDPAKETEDIIEHFNNEMESIDKSFDSALDDISKAYFDD